MDDDILQKLTAYLLERGYPQNSILHNYQADKYRADLVVVDKKTQTPLQFFIIKEQHTQNTFSQTKKLISKQISEINKINPDACGYLVFPKKETPFFSIIDPLNNAPVRLSDLNYKNLAQKGKNAKETLLNNSKTRAVGNLKWATFLLIGLICFVLLLDIFNIIEITGYRLYLILMIVILVLLPYYETIKVANFELTQKNKKK